MKKKLLCVLLAVVLCFDSIEFSMPVLAQALQQDNLTISENDATKQPTQEIALSESLLLSAQEAQAEENVSEKTQSLPVETAASVADDGAESTVVTDGFLTYTITGNNAVVTACDSAATGKIVIPDTINDAAVTEIAASVFKNNHNITEVILGTNIKIIGSDAFRNCSSLASVQIPASATVIDSYAFYDCVALQDLKLPTRVRSRLRERIFCPLPLTNAPSIPYFRNTLFFRI